MTGKFSLLVFLICTLSNLNHCVADIWSIMCANELHVSRGEVLDLVPEVFRMKFEPAIAIRVI
jgi:hypothetical protein